MLAVAAHLSYSAAAWKLSELATLDASSSVEQPPLPELAPGRGLLPPAPAAMLHSTPRPGLTGSRRLAPKKATGAAWRDNASSSAVRPPSTRTQPPVEKRPAVSGDPLATVDGVRASVMHTLDGVPPPRDTRLHAAGDSPEPGRDQARPSALAPRLGVHGVVATLMGDATEDAAPAPSYVAGDSRSGSSPVATWDCFWLRTPTTQASVSEALDSSAQPQMT